MPASKALKMACTPSGERWGRFAEHLKRQLDHVIGGKVDQAYGHDQHIEERRAMMRLWGDYCAEPGPATGTVLQMNRRRKGRNAS
jgi:hypothetical protein